MTLALHSAAAPDFELDELIEGCVRRGVSALALVPGAHAIDLSSAAIVQQAAIRLRSSFVHVALLEIVATDVVAPDVAARASVTLHAPVYVHGPVPPKWFADFAAGGGRLVEILQLNAATQNVMTTAQHRLAERRTLPSYIILRGGGPEAARYEGRGIGALLAWLALNAYSGTLVLAPTSQSVTPMWRSWLRHGKNRGCGSRKSDPSLIQIR